MRGIRDGVVLILLLTIYLEAATSRLTATATLTITAVVKPAVSISIIPENNYDSLDAINGEESKTIAKFIEKANIRKGYQVILTTQNIQDQQPYMRPDNPQIQDRIEYQLFYGGKPVRFQNGFAIVTDSDGPAITPIIKELAITIPPQQVKEAVYSDTLIVTIQAKE